MTKVEIRRLPTGVEGLDEVLGGGIPEFSFNLISGAPGCGKTTLAHQIMFANATPERPALYVTVLGEPPLKMLRYQQQYTFFDVSRIGTSVRFLHLAEDILSGGPAKALDRIVAEVEKTEPAFVFVDSFRAFVGATTNEGALQEFVQRLGMHLTTWEATTFLIGEYMEHELEHNPLFTMADGLVWLRQTPERNSVVRRAQVVKMRGQAQLPGLHTFRIGDDGVHVYPRSQPVAPSGLPPSPARHATGVSGLDEMLGGGFPTGYSVLVAGPSGSGKSLLATQFILEGIRQNEPGIIAVFEKRPDEYLQTLPDGKAMSDLVGEGSLRMMYLRPLDLSVEETFDALQSLVKEIGAKRIVIDSLSGFEVALAPAYRQDFRESLYRMLGALAGLGVTVLMTAELVESFTELRIAPHGISFLTDAVVLQRFVEVQGRIARAMGVIKLRGCAHSDELRSYAIGGEGITVGGRLDAYGQVTTGVPLLGPGKGRGTIPSRAREAPRKKGRR